MWNDHPCRLPYWSLEICLNSVGAERAVARPDAVIPGCRQAHKIRRSGCGVFCPEYDGISVCISDLIATKHSTAFEPVMSWAQLVVFDSA